MAYNIDDRRQELEAKLRTPNISEEERQKLFKLLETVQSPEGVQTMVKGITRKVIIVIVVSTLGMGLFIFGLMYGLTWYTSSVVEQTVPVPGDQARFDPVASLNDVRTFAGQGSELLSLEAIYVKSDGTMDLKATYKPNVEYNFFRETAAPEDAPPVGAGSSAIGKWYEPITIKVYEPGQWRHVKRMGAGVNAEYSYRNNGMERDTSNPVSSPQTPIPDPACSFADLWKIAIAQGAPAGAVAIIEYDEDGYTFIISDTKTNLSFDLACKLKK